MGPSFAGFDVFVNEASVKDGPELLQSDHGLVIPQVLRECDGCKSGEVVSQWSQTASGGAQLIDNGTSEFHTFCRDAVGESR